MRHVQLRAFHHVAIHRGFSRAAEALHVSQPAISDQVRKLEVEYDIRLFDRQKRQVQLTQKGQALLDITHQLFEMEHRALEFLSESRITRSGTLRIIADSAHHMTPVLTQFRQQYPEVSISVHAGNSEYVLDQLDRFDADIGVMGNLADGTRHDIVPLNTSPIIAFAPLDSVYAGSNSVSLRKLASWPLVLREQGSRTRRKLEEQAQLAGVNLHAPIEAEGREAVSQIVAAGGGVGIVSQAEFQPIAGMKTIRIRDMKLTMDEAIVCLKERLDNQLIHSFMTLAREHAGRT